VISAINRCKRQVIRWLARQASGHPQAVRVLILGAGVSVIVMSVFGLTNSRACALLAGVIVAGGTGWCLRSAGSTFSTGGEFRRTRAVVVGLCWLPVSFGCYMAVWAAALIAIAVTNPRWNPGPSSRPLFGLTMFGPWLLICITWGVLGAPRGVRRPLNLPVILAAGVAAPALLIWRLMDRIIVRRGAKLLAPWLPIIAVLAPILILLGIFTVAFGGEPLYWANQYGSGVLDSGFEGGIWVILGVLLVVLLYAGWVLLTFVGPSLLLLVVPVVGLAVATASVGALFSNWNTDGVTLTHSFQAVMRWPRPLYWELLLFGTPLLISLVNGLDPAQGVRSYLEDVLSGHHPHTHGMSPPRVSVLRRVVR
jgi:hypothetical protein